MTRIIISILILFSLSLSSRAQELNPVISGINGRIGFIEFTDFLEENYGIRSFFKNEWVENIELEMTSDSASLTSILGRSLYNANLNYSLVYPDKLYVLPVKKLTNRLPDYMIPIEKDWRHTTSQEVSESEQKYLQGRSADMREPIVIGNPRSSFPRGIVTISGKITNRESGEGIPGVTMVLTESGKGTATDVNGNLSIALRPGKYQVQFSFVGMKNELADLEVYEAGSFSLEMEPEVIALTEVQIVGNDFRKVQGTDMGLERINVNAITQIPVLMGEKDIIKVSQLLQCS